MQDLSSKCKFLTIFKIIICQIIIRYQLEFPFNRNFRNKIKHRIESVFGALKDDWIMKIIEIFDFPRQINDLVTF